MLIVLSKLWSQEDGAIVSAELMLVGTILVIGMIVGLKSVRDSVVTELADVAQAFANVNQSYSYSAIVGHDAFSGGGEFSDRADFCDVWGSDRTAQQSKCVDVCIDAFAEKYGDGHY